jgi:hypothetical protein
MYGRLNHMNMCVSYPTTLRLVDDISKLHTAPLKKWIEDKQVIKFWGDNVDKKIGEAMLHWFSIIVARSRTQAPLLARNGHLSVLGEIPPEAFLPTCEDVRIVKDNLVVQVSRILTRYFTQLVPFDKVVQKHIKHVYSAEMSKKSDVFVLDVLMKNEVEHKDMIEIMKTLQGYLGEDYGDDHPVLVGGDQLTCERMLGSQRHLMCGNTKGERLELLLPVSEDCVSLIGVS